MAGSNAVDAARVELQARLCHPGCVSCVPKMANRCGFIARDRRE
jgi:hypothetical protein